MGQVILDCGCGCPSDCPDCANSYTTTTDFTGLPCLTRAPVLVRFNTLCYWYYIAVLDCNGAGTTSYYSFLNCDCGSWYLHITVSYFDGTNYTNGSWTSAGRAGVDGCPPLGAYVMQPDTPTPLPTPTVTLSTP